MSKRHKTLHRNKEAVLDYWQDSAHRMKAKGTFLQLKNNLIFDHTWITTTKALLEEGSIREGDRLLDVGCGWGRTISGIKYFVPDTMTVGIDVNRIRLDQARRILDDLQLGDNVELGICDADDLGFRDGSFDVVVSVRLLQYVPDPVRTVKEFTRVLKPGGRLVITVPNKLNPIRFLTYGRVLYSPRAVKGWFVQNKLSDISCRTIGFLPTFRRVHWQSRLLAVEVAQGVPILNLIGGLVLCSGRKASD